MSKRSKQNREDGPVPRFHQTSTLEDQAYRLLISEDPFLFFDAGVDEFPGDRCDICDSLLADDCIGSNPENFFIALEECGMYDVLEGILRDPRPIVPFRKMLLFTVH